MSDINRYQTPQSQVDQQGVQQFSTPRVFSVSGRIGRLRFLAYSVGANMLLGVPINIAQAGLMATGTQSEGALVIVAGLAFIAIIAQLVFYFMFAIQRSHDMNMSGWLSLIILIPLVGFLIFLFAPGTKGENRFGAPPPPNGGGVILLALLLPIIAIIGILAAIAIPAYQGYIEESQQNQPQYEQPK
jgi:uncharacterized membrane protein YhaH (DUF805 family)